MVSGVSGASPGDRGGVRAPVETDGSAFSSRFGGHWIQMTERADGYRETLVAAGRTVWYNLTGVVIVTLAVWVTLVPLLATVAIGRPFAVLGGLWATCIALGVALVALFRYATTVVDREARVEVGASVRAAVEHPRVGMVLGASTFGVVVAGLGVVGLAPDGVRGTAAGLAGFLLVFWYLLVGFGSPELGAGESLRTALRAGGLRIGRSAVGTVGFLGLSALVSLAAGVTVVTLVLFLPGLLGLLAVAVATNIATVEDLSGGPADSDE